MGKSKKVNLKNNPDKRSQTNNPKRIESSNCEKCSTPCKEYLKYQNQLKLGKICYGVLCKY